MNEKIRFFEEMGANGHVALDVMQYDGWLLRFSEGHTSRANSVSVLYPSYIGTDEKIGYCEKQYAKMGLPCIFKVTDNDAELTALLEQKGYSIVAPTDVMVCSLSDSDFEVSGGCVFCGSPDEWLEPYFKFEELTDAHRQDVFRRMLGKVLTDTVYCTLMYDGRPAACASAAIERGYMLLQNVVVDPALRGQGLGRKVCASLIAKAKKMGAHHSWLQVVRDNAAAVSLYTKLGFEKIYSYQYMKK